MPLINILRDLSVIMAGIRYEGRADPTLELCKAQAGETKEVQLHA